ncbi:MAG: Oligopeptide-binding protein AppA [Gemmatimonadaceae bacterium]|nr:Oligopeptide-binding protein AppA [Gemmatimonadaceae bacterium]
MATNALLVALMSGAACAAPSERTGTVVYATGADLEGANPITTVHPLARQVQRHALLVTLTRYDSLLKPSPYFARRWTWSADRRVLSFALDSSLYWHDGVRTTARDAAFTLRAVMDPTSASPRAADVAAIDSVTAPDDTTLTIFFRSPQPALSTVFSELPIAPRHLLASVAPRDLRRASFNTAPVGNGPFRFLRRDPGQRWIFDRNPAFPKSLGGPPSIERLVVTLVDEPTTKFAGLVSGDLDVAGIAPSMAALVDRDPALRTIAYPVLATQVLVFNTARPPLDDIRVRRAIDVAIDRARLVRVALAGFGTPADGAIPPEHPAWTASARSPARIADSLLDAAGWTRGSGAIRSKGRAPLAFTLLTVGSGDNSIEQLIQADLRAHGIDMSIRQLELGAFLAIARAPAKEFDALITLVPGDLGLAYLRGMFDGALSGGALDYAGFHTAQLDSAFGAVRASTDARGERTAWQHVQRLLSESLPVTWLYHARGVQGVSRQLSGVVMDLRGELVTISRWTRAGTTRDPLP